MIDWFFVARHATWIAGIAIVVTSWSWHRAIVATAITRGGAALACVGIASVTRWWEAVLCLIAGALLWMRWKP